MAFEYFYMNAPEFEKQHAVPSHSQFPAISRVELADLLRDAERAHKAFEQKTGRTDTDWPSFYADYIFRSGKIVLNEANHGWKAGQ
jgi:hypothetical protein